MQQRVRQELARVRPWAIAGLLAFAPPLGLLLLWTARTIDRDARLLFTWLTVLNVCGQLALVTMLKG